MTTLIALLLGLWLPSTTYTLTVINGRGSGQYPCGASVTIVGDKKHGSEVFAQWHAGWDGDTAIERVHQRKATLTMPCKDVTVKAMFTAKGKR